MPDPQMITFTTGSFIARPRDGKPREPCGGCVRLVGCGREYLDIVLRGCDDFISPLKVSAAASPGCEPEGGAS